MLVEVLENKGENILIEKLKLIVYFEDLLFYAILMTYTMVWHGNWKIQQKYQVYLYNVKENKVSYTIRQQAAFSDRSVRFWVTKTTIIW